MAMFLHIQICLQNRSQQPGFFCMEKIDQPDGGDIALREIVKSLPCSPGVYLFRDKLGRVIYVGKAKVLRKRVSSYFSRNHFDNNKLRILVRQITKIDHVVVDTESDALLLENNLIKEYQPRYNVLLKDDKSYPYICVKNEPFPRVFLTRNPVRDGSSYFRTLYFHKHCQSHT
jgi:excinuclease ABC subunit C